MMCWPFGTPETEARRALAGATLQA
jgi:hypothetical protein